MEQTQWLTEWDRDLGEMARLEVLAVARRACDAVQSGKITDI